MIPLRHALSATFAAFVLTTSFARAEEKKDEVVQLTFKMLSAASHEPEKPPVIPDDLKKLEGKKVRITGFINPYADPENLTKLMLTEAAIGCFFCTPPQENSIVFVRVPEGGKPIPWETETITVEGTLHFMGHNKKDEDAEGFLFTIDDAEVVGKK